MDFSNIQESDIALKLPNMTILKPHIKKGILIWTKYNEKFPSIPKTGLKSRFKLVQEGLMSPIGPQHKSIFFRAPYSKPLKIDYTSLRTEIECLYNSSGIKLDDGFYMNKVFIRVDPRTTYTFSSEIRDVFTYPEFYYKPDIINKSKKTMIDYLDIIRKNEEITQSCIMGFTPVYNLFTSRAHCFLSDFKCKAPYNPYKINVCSEVLADIDILDPEYFCIN